MSTSPDSDHVPQAIAPPTDPRLSLPGRTPDAAPQSEPAFVRADAWLGDDTPTGFAEAPSGVTEVPSPAMSAMSATEIIDSGRLAADIGDDAPPVSAFDVEPSGEPLPRRAWDVGTSAIPESPVDDPFAEDTEPRPWPGADDAIDEPQAFSEMSMGDTSVPTPAPDGWATHDEPMTEPSDCFTGLMDAAAEDDTAYGDAETEPEPVFDLDAFDFSGTTSEPTADERSVEVADDVADADADKGGRLRNALGGLRRSLPGRKQDDTDLPPAPTTATEQIDDPLFAAAVADLDAPAPPAPEPTGAVGAVGGDSDTVEVTLAEYVDRREADGSGLGDEAEPVFSTTPESFFDQPEPAADEPADPVMALMADESEVEMGRSGRHKLVVAGAGALGVALLGAGVIGMLNRDRFETPGLAFGSDDEAPAALALDEPEISVTEQLAAGLVRIDAGTCATATGGGGVLVSATTVVTAAEVTGTSPTVDITLANGEARVGTLIGIDNQSGLAVINLDRPADGSLAWGATNSIDIGSALAVSSVEGDAPVMEASLGSKLVIAAVTTELALAAELPVQPGGAVVNERGEVVAVALADGDVTALVASDVLRPMVSEFRLDPERFSGC